MQSSCELTDSEETAHQQACQDLEEVIQDAIKQEGAYLLLRFLSVSVGRYTGPFALVCMTAWGIRHLV